jgi:hypothetical protein
MLRCTQCTICTVLYTEMGWSFLKIPAHISSVYWPGGMAGLRYFARMR